VNTNSNINANDTTLQQHIGLLGCEFRSSAVRAIAAEVALADGLEKGNSPFGDDNVLYQRVSKLVGYEANQESYVDSYAPDEDGFLFEPAEGQAFLIARNASSRDNIRAPRIHSRPWWRNLHR